jgi:hypothetical protein
MVQKRKRHGKPSEDDEGELQRRVEEMAPEPGVSMRSQILTFGLQFL